jgi:hypothetical protein
MGGLTMGTRVMNDDGDIFHLFIRDRLDNIWVYVCMDNALSGRVHYYYYYYYYY